MRRLLTLTATLCVLISPSWAATASFVPDGPGGPSTLSANWDPATHAFTIQGYFGQGVTPGSWVVDSLPVYQDLNAWFSLSTTLHMDGTVAPGGLVQLYGFSEAAGAHDPAVLFSGTLAGTTVQVDSGHWSLPCAVGSLAEPFAAQAWNPASCAVAFDVSPYWTWDPFHLSGQPIITFEGTNNPVPEPGTWALMVSGLVAMVGYRAWRRRAA